MRPGAKTGLIQALQAQGATVSADFTLVNAFAGAIPTGLLRAARNNPDVLSISTNAPVQAFGITSDVTGAALNSPYSLRNTLGLGAPTAITAGASTSAVMHKVTSLAWSHTVTAGSDRVVDVGGAVDP